VQVGAQCSGVPKGLVGVGGGAPNGIGVTVVTSGANMVADAGMDTPVGPVNVAQVLIHVDDMQQSVDALAGESSW
jgi:hypothetical protein